MVPLPDKLPIVSEKLAKSKVPFTTVAELFGITPAAPNFKVPAVIVVVPEYALLAFDNVNVELPFSVIFVTLEPIAALIKVELPDPELVIVPVLLTDNVDKVILSAVALLFCKMKFPVPVTPPVTVKELFKVSTIKVVAVELTTIAPIDNAEDVALC